MGGEPPASADAPTQATSPAWVLVARPEQEALAGPPLSTRRVVVQLVAGILVVLAAVTIGGSLAARRLAEREAVNDAAQIADVLAETVIQPELTDALYAGSPAAQRQFDQLVRDRVLGDERRPREDLEPPRQGPLLRPARAHRPHVPARPPRSARCSTAPRTVAEISDLDRAENSLDRQIGDKLVEVYRPVWTSTGQEALFEIYAPYDQVGKRTSQLWRGFAGVTLSSLLLFVVLVAPLVWHLLSRVRRSQRQRELLLQRAVDASDAERRRIAATLHDGPVQDLAATSFVIAGATAHAESAGRTRLAEELRSVAGSVRTSIRALRSLLVDIYPPSLAQAGLPVALTDLAQTVRAPGLTVVVEPVQDAELGLRPDQERLVYRVAQETLRNAAKHATPCIVRVSLHREGEDVLLDVVDDGRASTRPPRSPTPSTATSGCSCWPSSPPPAGATLQVASAPGQRDPLAAAGAPRLDLRHGDRRDDESAPGRRPRHGPHGHRHAARRHRRPRGRRPGLGRRGGRVRGGGDPPGRGADGPLHARRRRRRGDPTDPRRPARGADRGAHVVLRPGPGRRRPGRRRRGLPAQGLRAGRPARRGALGRGRARPDRPEGRRGAAPRGEGRPSRGRWSAHGRSRCSSSSPRAWPTSRSGADSASANAP